MSRVFLFSGIGIIMSFWCLITSPAIKLQDKHLIILNNGYVKCSSTKTLFVINLFNNFSKNSNASWCYFFLKSTSRICFDNQPLTIITKCSIFDVAAVVDSPLITLQTL